MGEMPLEKTVLVKAVDTAIAAEIQHLEDGYQFGQTLHHSIGFAEFFLIVEVGDVDRPLQAVVGVCQLADDLVDPVANLLVPLAAIMPAKPLPAGASIRAFGSPAYLSETYLMNNRIRT